MFFNRKNDLKTILEKARAKRDRDLEDMLYNVLFLDYDGVVNIFYPGSYERFSKSLIDNVSRLCRQFDLNIVVSSSWKMSPDYADYLYEAGLDPEVKVLGKTDDIPGPREEEIKKYLQDHIYIDKFIILDDGLFNELRPYQVRTTVIEGFNDEKLEEATRLFEKQEDNR
ncbi:MAG: hypothetical protein K6A14_02810 [Erysipelotrichaceae bacterium]|nr:hypothetical protein [Erysipelotrichaceae bacterium]